jgi:hypothetical protein
MGYEMMQGDQKELGQVKPYFQRLWMLYCRSGAPHTVVATNDKLLNRLQYPAGEGGIDYQ